MRIAPEYAQTGQWQERAGLIERMQQIEPGAFYREIARFIKERQSIRERHLRDGLPAQMRVAQTGSERRDAAEVFRRAERFPNRLPIRRKPLDQLSAGFDPKISDFRQ